MKFLHSVFSIYLLFHFFIARVQGYVNINKLLRPGQRHMFVESITGDIEQFQITITSLSENPGLRYSIKVPDDASSNDDNVYSMNFEDEEDTDNSVVLDESLIGKNVDYQKPIERIFKAPGVYSIHIENVGSSIINYNLFSIISKKALDSDKEIMELNESITIVNESISRLNVANNRLKQQYIKDSENAKQISRYINMMIFFPFLMLIMDVYKQCLVRYLITPRRSSFKRFSSSK